MARINTIQILHSPLNVVPNTTLDGDVGDLDGPLAKGELAWVDHGTGGAAGKLYIGDATAGGAVQRHIGGVGTGAVAGDAGNLTGTTLAAGVVSTSITSLGTIGTGVWQGTDVGVAYGGTGASSLSAAGIVTTSGGADLATALNTDLGANFTIGNQASDSATFTGDVTVSGDLNVTGNTTQLDSTATLVKDKEIFLGVAGGTSAEATATCSGTTITVTSTGHGLGTSGTKVLLILDPDSAFAGLVTPGIHTATMTDANTFTLVSTVSETVSGTNAIYHSLAVVTDATASGSGIYVPGADMKSIAYNSTDAEWQSSEKITISGVSDTAADDNATMGYTAADGLILTGQGTTSDITLKNDADSNVMTVATGTTAVTFPGSINVTGSYNLATGDIPDNAADTSGTAALATDIAAGTVGQIVYQTGANATSFLAGNTSTTKKFLQETGNGSAAAAPSWGALVSADIPANASNTSGTAGGLSSTLTVATGGTGATSLTDKAVLISQDSGTDTVGSVALTTSGQVIIGGSSGPAAATLTAGSNIAITNGDGSISIAADNDNDDVSVANLKTALASGFAAGAVQIGDSNDVVTIGSDLSVTNGLVVGHTAPIAFADGTHEAQILGTTEADATLAIGLFSATDALSPTMKFMKSGHASIGASNNTTVADNEELGKIQAYGADGTDLATLSSEIAFNIDDDGVGAGTLGGEILLKTSAKSGTLTTAVTIDSSQNVTFANAIDGGTF